MWKLLGKLVLLGAARRWARRPTAALETAALALVLSERRLGHGAKRDLLLHAAHVVFLPAAVIKSARLVKRLACGKRRGTTLGGPPLALPAAGALEPLAAAAAGGGSGGLEGGLRPGEAEEVAAPFPTFRHQPPPLPRPVPRAEWGLLQIPEVAPQYEAWVGCLRNVLAQQGLRSLPPEVDPDGLELTRYLLYCGLLAATKPAEAARAVAVTAARITSSINWRTSYPFMTEAELKDWEDVAWWAGPDENGSLWLHLHLAPAMARCVRGEGRQCVQAIVSQLDHSTRVMMPRGRAAAAEGGGCGGGAAASALAGLAAAAAAAAGGHGGSGSETPMSTSSYGTLPAAAAGPGAGVWGSGVSAGGSDRDGDGGAPRSSAAAAVVAAAAAAVGANANGAGRKGGDGGRRRTSRRQEDRRRGGGGGSSGTAAAAAARDFVPLDDRIKVVVIGSGSNVRQALRMFPIFREFARLVQLHYPGRLRTMYLADMPRGLRMSLGAVLNLLSTETRQKVKICKIEDLPDTIATALILREQQQQQRQQCLLQQQQQQRQQLQPHDHTTQQPRWLLHGGCPHALPQPDGTCEVGPEGDTDGGGRPPSALWAPSSGAGPRRLLAALAALVLALPTAVVTRGSLQPAVSCVQQLTELRRWLLRVVPALLMAAMACLTYKSILARP